MITDPSFDTRLRSFLADSVNTPPPADVVPRALQALTRRRWVPRSAISAAVAIAAVAAVVIVAVGVHLSQQAVTPPRPILPQAATSPSPSEIPVTNIDSAAGERQCLAQRSEGEQLEAEYDTTAGVTDAWVHNLLPGATAAEMPLAGLPPATPVSFCYLYAAQGYAIPYPGTLPGQSPPPPETQRVVAVDSSGAAFTLTYWSGSVTRPPSVAPTPTPAPSATARWVPFSSTAGAFSFKRPPSWALYGPCVNSGQVLGDPTAIEVRVGPDLHSNGCGSDLWIDLVIDSYARTGPPLTPPSCDSPITTSSVMVDGVSGTRVAGRCSGAAYLSYSFTALGRVYELSYDQEIQNPDGSTRLGPDMTADIDLMMQQTWAFHG